MGGSSYKVPVLVVGLGAMGAATLYQLARRGVAAVGIDRWRPPHALGSSHGETRVTRVGVGEGDAYAPFALRSHEIWRDLESTTGARLMLVCGTLTIESPGAAAVHGRAGFLSRSQAVAQRHGVPHELLDAGEIAYRYPQLALRGDEQAYYEPGGGAVFPEACIAAQLMEAQRLGARVVTDTDVTSIVETAGGVQAKAGRDTYEADAAVIAAGAWSPGLTGGALHALALQPQALHWFECHDPIAYAPERFPTFMWVHGPDPGDAFYGFPQIQGLVTPGVKVATETSDEIDSADHLDRDVTPAAAAQMYSSHVSGRLQGVGPRAIRSAACLYATAPDGDFVIGTPQGRPRTWVVSACSGHGFKHSAAIGERLAAHLCGEAQASIPATFDLARPALRITELLL